MELFSPPPSYVFETPSGLADLPRTEIPTPTYHWLGDDGQNAFIEIQGNFAAVAFRKGPLSKPRKKRGKIVGFSPASRLRMFKVVNRLDFSRAGPSTFATMTWRDSWRRPGPDQLTAARSAMQKWLERRCRKLLSGIWRVEWQLRKTGEYKDEFMPHVHMILFDIPWVDKVDFRQAWSRSAGHNDYVSVKLEKIDSRWKCLNYIAKYVAKLDHSCNLDIPSYLAEQLAGRKWGTYHKELLPYADSTSFRTFPGPVIEQIRAVATAAYAKTPQEVDSGFTVFGEAAKAIQKIVDNFLLTQPEKPV